MSGAAPLRLLYEDPELVIVDKPAGLLTIPGRGEQAEDDVQALLEKQLGRRVWVVHRLDRGTSGALAFALNADSHRAISRAFEAGQVGKRYLALVQGALRTPMGEIDRALVPARRGKMRPASPGEEGKESLTIYKVREQFARYSWVELEPRTGRQHQLRVHLSSIGHPLAVDETYRGATQLTASELGGEGEGVVLARTPLHCQWLSVPRFEKGPAIAEAPLPPDLERALGLLRGYEVTDPAGVIPPRD